MKKIFTFTFILTAFLNICVFLPQQAAAQSPQRMSYQAVIRDNLDHLITSHVVGIKITILQSSTTGTVVYTEIQTPTTNANGLLSIEIGSEAGFSAIDWANGPYFIKTETDPAGGTNYTINGTSQLLSVPYALYTKTAETLTKKNAVEGNLITYDGTNWVAKNALTNISGANQSHNNMQPYLVLNYCIALEGIYPTRNSVDPFVGEIELFGFNFAPMGYASCDGQLLQISQNSALYSLLGTTYGGDGRTTFGLPDLRGRVPIHFGNGPGLSSRTIGEKSGFESHTMTINQMPSHSHTIIYQ